MKVFNMIQFATISQWRQYKNNSGMAGKTIGFVPTMGALHSGHLSLIKKSKKENDVTMVSIFVNKPQFNDKSDYVDYPQDTEKDVQLLETLYTDFLLIPEYKELYSDDYRFKVTENSFSKLMEGKHRPGHFDGVLTVVMKLLVGIAPSKSYFGEKDYQQYLLIKKMTKTFFIDTEIIPCNTVRESSGLACSSRNNILSPKDRARASEFYHILSKNISKKEMQTQLENSGFTVDYIKNLNNRRLGAVVLNNVRLIDNVTL